MAKKTGWLEKYQDEGEVKPAANDVIPSSSAMATKALQQLKGTAYNNQRDDMLGQQSYIRESEPDRSVPSSVWAGISHPSTLLSYIAKGEGVPQHFDRGPENPLEYATDIVNPAWYINSIASVPGNVARGEFGSAALNALSVLPLASIAKPGYKAVVEAAGKYTPDASRLTEGILNFNKGLKEFPGNLRKIGDNIAEKNPITAFNGPKLRALEEQEREMGSIANDFRLEAIDIENSMNQKLTRFDNLIWKNVNANQVGGDIENKLWQANYRLDNYKKWTEGITKEGDDLVKVGVSNGLSKVTTTGKAPILHFRTNSKVDADVQLPKTETRFSKDPVSKAIKTENRSTNDVMVSDSYVNTVRDNIAYIEEKTGAKVFGSSRGIAEGGLPHIAHDYDVLISRAKYDNNIKSKLPFVKDNGLAKTHSLDTKFGQEGDIDFNIIEQSETGFATGQRAEELFKQISPTEYYAEARKAAVSNKPIVINYTPDKLLEEINPTTKTIVDAYESTKAKHINRIDSYISFGNPKAVLSAQNQYVKSLVGNKGSLGHQFDPTHFANPEANKQLLDDIGFIGDVNIVSKDTKKMQVALNDYYINNTILSRGSGSKISDVRKMSTSDLSSTEASFKVWDPSQEGGQAMGSGMNHVVMGDSGHGPFYGNKQLGIETNIENPIKYVDSIKKQTSGFYPYTQQEQVDIQDILSKHGVLGYNIIKNPGELIRRTAYSDKAPQILKEVADLTGRKAAITTLYGRDATYASTLKDFDDQIDALEFALRDQITIPKSAELRRKNLESISISSNTNIGSEKSFLQVSSLLEDGLKKITERKTALQQQQTGIMETYDRMREKFSDSYKGLETLNKQKEVLKAKELEYAQQSFEIQNRLRRLRSIRDNVELSLKVTSVPAAAAALFKLIPESKSGKRSRKYRERQDSLKQASATPDSGFVGMESDTTNRDYSGGQFQNGGILQDGGIVDRLSNPESLSTIREASIPKVQDVYDQGIFGIIKSPMQAYVFEQSYNKLRENNNVPTDTLRLTDNRSINAVTGKPVLSTDRMSASPDRSVLRDIRDSANRVGIDPTTGFAMAMQESGYDALNPLHNNTQSLDDYETMKKYATKYPQGVTRSNLYDESFQLLKDKMAGAKRRGKRDEASQLQSWNGEGIVDIPGGAYGMKGRIDMSKNPVYGKRVLDLRDNVIRKNPEIMKLVNSKMNNGGELKKLDQLTNFTNYNKPTSKGWLEKYL